MQDTFKHRGQRRLLVEYLQNLGISDELVLKAIGRVPRHFFLESVFEDFAYEDRPFPIAAGQTISHPSTVAEQTELLCVEPYQKILEIGTGSGYQTAVLVAMGAEVYTIERQRELVTFSHEILKKMKLSPKMQTFGDGFEGRVEQAPFDRILVTCGARELPEKLLTQLRPGGLMVIPLGEAEEQILVRFRKVGESTFEKEEFGAYKFVPMLKKTNR